MSEVFISHLSNDRMFVSRLAANLEDAGYRARLDEWEIQESGRVFPKVEQEIVAAGFVIVVLSAGAARSGWIENYWKDIFSQETEREKPQVISVLLEECQIPQFLTTAMTADFKGDYTNAFVKLLSILNTATAPPLFTYDLLILGIRHFHKERSEARLVEHLEAAQPGSQINILGIALTDLVQTRMRAAVKAKLEQGCQFRLLTLDPDSPHGEQKAMEENRHFSEWAAHLKTHREALQTLPNLVAPELRKNIVLAEYDAPPHYFIFMTIKTIVVGFYVRDRFGTDSFHLELDVKENGVYIQFYNHFRSLWESTGRSWNGFS